MKASSTVASMPEGQVDSLMHEVADEYGLEVDEELSANPVAASQVKYSILF